jgi:hypothetical protein
MLRDPLKSQHRNLVTCPTLLIIPVAFLGVVMSLLFTVLYWLIGAIRPFLVPLCFVMAWGLILIMGWSIVAALRDGMQRVKQLHEIPCANCRFFTNSYHLKCSVHPSIALSEEAIGCRDYEGANEMERRLC